MYVSSIVIIDCRLFIAPGDTMSVEKLCDQDLSDSEKATRWGVDWMHSTLYLMVNQN